MAELIISQRAELELREIWRYIATDNPDAADGILLRIAERLEALRDFPDLGTRRDEIRPNARILLEGPYLLLYEHHREHGVVELVSVVDARRDLSDLF